MYQVMLQSQNNSPYAGNSTDVTDAPTLDTAFFVGATKVTVCGRESRKSEKERIQNKGDKIQQATLLCIN